MPSANIGPHSFREDLAVFGHSWRRSRHSMAAVVSTSFAFSICFDRFAGVLFRGALLIRSQTLELSKAVPCSEAAHESYELIRVEKECRRVFLDPGDLRWVESSFRHTTYTHYKAARLLICSAVERVMSVLARNSHDYHCFLSRNAFSREYPWNLVTTADRRVMTS